MFELKILYRHLKILKERIGKNINKKLSFPDILFYKHMIRTVYNIESGVIPEVFVHPLLKYLQAGK